MAGNGNDPRLEQLEHKLRGVAPVAAGMPVEPEPIYDLAARVTETAQAMRDLARYSDEVASDLERIVSTYITHMSRLMGKLK